MPVGSDQSAGSGRGGAYNQCSWGQGTSKG